MELDAVQQWVDNVNSQCQKLLEDEEWYLNLLGKVKKPWLLSQAPEAVQDDYRMKHLEAVQKSERLAKQSLLDEELNNINTILQKARLLHDANDKVKESAKIKGAPTKTKTIKMNGKPQGTTEGKQTSANSKPYTGKPATMRGKGTARDARASQLKNRSASNPQGISTESEKTVKKSAKGTTTILQPKEDHAINHATPSHFHNPDASEQRVVHTNGVPSNLAIIDETMVKLQFLDVKSQLSLPLKLRKLISNHAKLREQVLHAWNDAVCTEEMTFSSNIKRKSNQLPDFAQTQTQESSKRAIIECLRICANALNAIKNTPGDDSPSKVTSKSPCYRSCLVSLTLDVTSEICNTLKRKFADILQTGVFDFDDSVPDRLDFTGIPHMQGLHDGLLLPTATIYHETVASVRQLFIERLTHQCLILEYELLRKITESYFALINRLSKSEHDSVPSPELTHVLKNLYGILNDVSLLHPAFVVAD